MTHANYITLIKTQGFCPIRIEGEAEKEESKSNIVIGSIESFFDAAHALDAKVIFIYSSLLSEDYFKYEIDFDEVEDDTDIEKNDSEVVEIRNEIDLTVVLPSLAEFRKYIGTEYAFFLTAKGGKEEVSYFQEEEWKKQFDDDYYKAVEKVEEDEEAISEKIEKLQEEKDNERVKILKSLINDAEFVCIPTLRSMKAYALEKHPELEKMDEFTFTEEIQFLSDKIKAKGLNKKRK